MEPKKLIVQGIACNIQGRLLQELVFYSLMKKEKRKKKKRSGRFVDGVDLEEGQQTQTHI